MADLKLSTRKLNALQYASLQNALRLHFDSVFLAKGRSFASAFAISVIASEEFGKAFGLAEIDFQARLNKGFCAEDDKYLRLLLSDHKSSKDNSCHRSSILLAPKTFSRGGIRKYRLKRIMQYMSAFAPVISRLCDRFCYRKRRQRTKYLL